MRAAMNTRYCLYAAPILVAVLLLVPALNYYGVLLATSIVLGGVLALVQGALILISALVVRMIRAVLPGRHPRTHLPFPNGSPR